jgi:hypothetical protein
LTVTVAYERVKEEGGSTNMDAKNPYSRLFLQRPRPRYARAVCVVAVMTLRDCFSLALTSSFRGTDFVCSRPVLVYIDSSINSGREIEFPFDVLMATVADGPVKNT